ARPPPPSSPLCPYTTLFRSSRGQRRAGLHSVAFPIGQRLLPAGRAGCISADCYTCCTAGAGNSLSFSNSHAEPSSTRKRQSITRSEEHTSELQSREKLVCRL